MSIIKNQTFAELRDTSIITAAELALKSAGEYAIATAAQVDEARAELQAAKDAAQAAADGDGNDPLAAEVRVEMAERAFRVSERVSAGAEGKRLQAIADLQTARGDACKPAYLAGLAARFRGATKYDQAQALLREAQAEFETGTDWMRQARQSGVQHNTQHSNPDNLKSVAEETEIWTKFKHPSVVLWTELPIAG